MSETILLISRCCGKGHFQAKCLHRELKAKGMEVEYKKVRPNQAINILNRYSIDANTDIPYIYINDILIPAEKLNDQAYFLQIVSQLSQSYLNKIEKKDVKTQTDQS